MGLGVLVVSWPLMLAGVEPVATYFTALAWTGYVLLVDALVFRLKGRSLIVSRPLEFALMVPWSVGAWLIFEAYNLHLRNWHYVGMPENPWLQTLGYAWAFATILPGVLETTDLVEAMGLFAHRTIPAISLSATKLEAMALTGVAFLVVPLLVPTDIARFLFALVWVGFVLVLEPVLLKTGGRALLRELALGDPRRLYHLLIAGFLCGLLWEFWNFWARAKWIYDLPSPLNVGFRIFEMPMLGFLGFPAFAVECYVLQNLMLLVVRRLRPRVVQPADLA